MGKQSRAWNAHCHDILCNNLSSTFEHSYFKIMNFFQKQNIVRNKINLLIVNDNRIDITEQQQSLNKSEFN